jgi:heterodisulfide reductase subunit A
MVEAISKAMLDSVLVIGGGIAGIRASLDLADQGYRVYLVERTPSIGGVMAQLDKTFPTNDCSICIEGPLMSDVASHKNIDLLTYHEVKKVEGGIGNFKVEVVKKARGVNIEECNGCEECSKVCPVRVPNDFEMGLAVRPAIYKPFPQAVPNIVTIDYESCINCGFCELVCGRNAIIRDDKDETIILTVGSIIVAIGYDIYEPHGMTEYGYGVYPNVLTALQFERLQCASGPTGGHIIRPFDGRVAKRIAIIQCIGSRSKKRPYCSRFCCTHATKEAIIAKEHEKAIEEIHIFYNEMRQFGKGFEEYYQRSKEEYGINYIKGIPGEIEQKDNGDLIIKYEDQKERKFKKMEVDLVVLSTAAVPKKGIDELAEKLGIDLDEYGFIRVLDPDISPVDTIKPGIYACGACSGPKDIPESCVQASGTAARASRYVEQARIEEKLIEEKDVTGQEPRIGVFVCYCGVNIGGYVDVPSVTEYAKTLPNVVHAEATLYTCSQDSLFKIKEAIKKHDLNRVVVASCTPRTHEPLFRRTCREAGLNKYLFEMANIRDQDSWVHMNEPEAATEKAKALVRMTVAKSRLLEPGTEKEIDIHPTSLVIGAGVSGMTAALNIAEQGFKVYLVEKEAELGGLLKGMHKVFPEDRRANELLDSMIRKVEENKNIEVHTSTIIKSIKGYIGNFEASLEKEGRKEEIKIGTIVVATGAKPLKPNGYYGYGEYENVITQFELEKLLAEDKLNAPKNIGMILCVGAREKEGRAYCSRVCCMVAIKNARYLKEKFPDANIYVINRDVRTFGETEEYYRKARFEGIRFVRYSPEKPPEVKQNEDKTLKVDVYDETLGQQITLNFDLVVLSTPLIPPEDNKILSRLLKIPLDQNGFFLEAHVKLRPVDFATAGIYLCGTAHSPKDIADSISQALGASSRAAIPLKQKRVKVEAITSFIDEDKCTGCGTCIELCPYGAWEKDEKSMVQLREALCKGCGVCAASCPEKAIDMHHFTDDQLIAQVRAALEEVS